jgi:hypothetical protein
MLKRYRIYSVQPWKIAVSSFLAEMFMNSLNSSKVKKRSLGVSTDHRPTEETHRPQREPNTICTHYFSVLVMKNQDHGDLQNMLISLMISEEK